MLSEANQLPIIAPPVHPGTSGQRCVMLIVCVNAQFVCGCEPSDPDTFMLLSEEIASCGGIYLYDVI